MKEEQAIEELEDIDNNVFANRLVVAMFLDSIEKDSDQGGIFSDHKKDLFDTFEEMTGITGDTMLKRLFWAFDLGASAALDLREKLDAYALQDSVK